LIRLFELIMYIGVIFLSNLILNLNQTELMLIRWCFSINSTWFPLTLGHPHFLLSTQHLSSFLFSISPSAAYAICLYFCFMLIKWLSSIQIKYKEEEEKKLIIPVHWYEKKKLNLRILFKLYCCGQWWGKILKY